MISGVEKMAQQSREVLQNAKERKAENTIKMQEEGKRTDGRKTE